MISLKKLLTLKPEARLRKIVRLLDFFEKKYFMDGSLPDSRYFRGLLGFLIESAQRVPQASSAATEFPGEQEEFGRFCNRLRNALLRDLGEEPAEWDFSCFPSPRDALHDVDGVGREGDLHGGAEGIKRRTFPISVYLEDIRSPFNAGSIFRTAEAFGMESAFLSPDCVSPDHDRAKRVALGAVGLLPYSRLHLDELMEGGYPVFVLETGGTNINKFRFPTRGTIILGSEELGVSPEALKLADDSYGRVTIPLYGNKRSLNVSVAFGIAAAWWTAKLSCPD